MKDDAGKVVTQFIHLSQRDLAEKKQQQFVSNECRKINSILIEKNLKHKLNNNFNNLFCLTHSNQCSLTPTYKIQVTWCDEMPFQNRLWLGAHFENFYIQFLKVLGMAGMLH